MFLATVTGVDECGYQTMYKHAQPILCMHIFTLHVETVVCHV